MRTSALKPIWPAQDARRIVDIENSQAADWISVFSHQHWIIQSAKRATPKVPTALIFQNQETTIWLLFWVMGAHNRAISRCVDDLKCKGKDVGLFKNEILHRQQNSTTIEQVTARQDP
jgi:hypothetical protein